MMRLDGLPDLRPLTSDIGLVTSGFPAPSASKCAVFLLSRPGPDIIITRWCPSTRAKTIAAPSVSSS